MNQAFRVNTYQDRWQRNPDVMALPDGGFIVVYESYIDDDDNDLRLTAILSQRYDAAGAPVGGETIIDAVNGSRSAEASVSLLSDGGYAVAWTYDNYDPILTLDTAVYVKAFDVDGAARFDAVRVDTVPSNDAILPEVYGTANGGFTVVFGVDRSTDLFDQIYSQRFDRSGTTIGSNTLVNVNEGQFDEILARSATLTNGSTVTIWNSEGSIETGQGRVDGNGIRGTITNSQGAAVRQDFALSVNYGSPGGGSGAGYDVAALQTGGFVIVNMNYDFDLGFDDDETLYYIVLRFYDAGGDLVSGPVIADVGDRLPDEARVAQLESGAIAVVWAVDDDSPSFVGDTVYGRIFSPSGAPLTDRFDVGDPVPSFVDQEDPEIAALAGGGFVVTFMSEYIDADHEGVAARIFAPVAYEGGEVDPDDPLPGSGDGLVDGGPVAGPPTGGDGAVANRGSDGADTLTGGAGADTIKAGGGDDTVDGGDGDDVILSGDGNDLMRGGGGDDTLKPGRGDDTIEGGAGDDVVTGFRGDEVMRGGAGADTLLGNLDDDTLEGGAGDDRLQGGPGRDVFVFAEREFGNDRIVLDYRVQSDVLDFRGSGIGASDLRVSQAGANVLIEIESGDSSILLSGSRFGELAAADIETALTTLGGAFLFEA